MPDGHKRVNELVDYLHQLHRDKSHKYGTERDPLANYRANEPRHQAYSYARDRLNEKLSRLRRIERLWDGDYYPNPKELFEETIDLALLALIIQALYEEFYQTLNDMKPEGP
jgi:hypothetical protein